MHVVSLLRCCKGHQIHLSHQNAQLIYFVSHNRRPLKAKGGHNISFQSSEGMSLRWKYWYIETHLNIRPIHLPTPLHPPYPLAQACIQPLPTCTTQHPPSLKTPVSTPGWRVWIKAWDRREFHPPLCPCTPLYPPPTHLHTLKLAVITRLYPPLDRREFHPPLSTFTPLYLLPTHLHTPFRCCSL